MNHTFVGVDMASGHDVSIPWPTRTTPAILGLCGLPGCGKDACADVLERFGFRRIAFADALRREICENWGVDVRLLQDRGTKGVPLGALAIGRCGERSFVGWARRQGLDLSAPRSPRWLMQRYATEFRRDRDPDYWVRQARLRMLDLMVSGETRFVVTDVRFVNEASMLQMAGARIVRVYRRELEALTPDTADHESNRLGRLPVDAHLVNDGTLEALAAGVVDVTTQLFGREVLAGGAR